jgi:hypothetical protein
MSYLAAKILGAALLLGIAFIGVLAVLQQPIPDPLSLVVASSLTGFLGLLATSPDRTRNGALDVSVRELADDTPGHRRETGESSV